MNKADIKNTLKQALTKARKLRITFNRNSISDIPYLLGMERSKIITIDPSDHLVLLAVMESRDWEYDDNRKVKVSLQGEFGDQDQEWFAGRMSRALDKCEAV